MPSAKVKKVPCFFLIEPPKQLRLKELSHRTRIPMSALLREAVDDLLHKHRTRVASEAHADREAAAEKASQK